MNGKKVMLTIQGEKKEYPAGTSFLRIAQDTAMRIRMILFWYCTIGDCGN